MDLQYMQSVIKDREREVEKIVKDNQNYRYLREPNIDERDSAEKGKNILNSWLLMVGRLIKSVLEITNKGDVKV